MFSRNNHLGRDRSNKQRQVRFYFEVILSLFLFVLIYFISIYLFIHFLHVQDECS